MEDAEYMERRRLSFGAMAADYDRSRPDYPEQLVRDVLSHVAAGVIPQAGGATRALEVGAGTGKATLQFAAHGVAIHALEPSAEMGRILADRCIFQRKVTIERSEFESAELPEQSFELVYSAQAWHWTDPERRYTLARRALVDGGTLAVFWNAPDWPACELVEPLESVYRRLDVRLSNNGPMVPRRHAPLHLDREQWRGEIEASDGFDEPVTTYYRWRATYRTSDYTDLLATHSDHALLPADLRGRLFDALAGVIDDRGGGMIELPHTTLLGLARAV